MCCVSYFVGYNCDKINLCALNHNMTVLLNYVLILRLYFLSTRISQNEYKNPDTSIIGNVKEKMVYIDISYWYSDLSMFANR